MQQDSEGGDDPDALPGQEARPDGQAVSEVVEHVGGQVQVASDLDLLLGSGFLRSLNLLLILVALLLFFLLLLRVTVLGFLLGFLHFLLSSRSRRTVAVTVAALQVVDCKVERDVLL